MGIEKALSDFLSPVMDSVGSFFQTFPFLGITYTSIVRWVLVILALYVIVRSIKSLLEQKTPSEIWAYLALPDGSNQPLKHWENVLGRAKSSDVVLDYMTVSRSHGTLSRSGNGDWHYSDLNSKGGSQVNGSAVIKPVKVVPGDVITMAGINCTFVAPSLSEKLENINDRKRSRKQSSPWSSLVALTIMQVLIVIQFLVAEGPKLPAAVPVAFFLLTCLMWGYCIFLKIMRRTAFDMETIAFFLCTLNLAVVATSSPLEIIKQFIAIALGVGLFFVLCWYMRDIDRALKIRKFLVIASILLLLFNLFFGTFKYGATNWVKIGGFTIQPSELVKIAFIFIGSATLDELYEKKNLTLFLLFSGFCLGSLAIMGDFGTAAIFFVTFVVISYLRSGDFSKLVLIVGAAVAFGLMILRFKPYIANRFATWGNAWEFADAGGYQQTRTMTYSASGGIPGLGSGNGYLHQVGAADTDLVFGILVEEYGFVIGVLAVLSIITLCIFAVRSITNGRSTFYTIAACAATTLFIFQTMLNVFGAVDLFPLTGVTFPFVSNGGTSMLASWGLLAFLKAADTRLNASIAVTGENKNTLEGGTF